MENECDEMAESDFQRWVMRNFCERKEHVLNQCKETKNLEQVQGNDNKKKDSRK